MSLTGNQILHTLAYFDIFRYPLTGNEINMYHGGMAGETQIAENLDELVRTKQVFTNGSFYGLYKNPLLFERRLKGNQHANELLPLARKVGRFLYHFPFVRAVGISGSLSKQFAEPDADLDFFIITATGRVWVARTLLHLLKKISFLFGRQHWFCMNYFIAGSAPVIEEKNIFTATEIVTLIPVCGKKFFADFFAANAWVNTYYPKINLSANLVPVEDKPDGFLKKTTEKILSGKAGDRLDDYWLKLTSKRWADKEKNRVNKKGFPMGLKAEKQAARPRPEYFQQKILDAYAKRTALLQTGTPMACTG